MVDEKNPDLWMVTTFLTVWQMWASISTLSSPTKNEIMCSSTWYLIGINLRGQKLSMCKRHMGACVGISEKQNQQMN